MLSWPSSRTKFGEDPDAVAIVSAAGAAAAMSAIFGNPLVAVVIFLELLGLGRRQTLLVVLPCLVASGVGALLFTGLGQWTGLGIGVLAIPHLTPARLGVAEVVWALPLAAVIAALSLGGVLPRPSDGPLGRFTPHGRHRRSGPGGRCRRLRLRLADRSLAG